MRRCLVLNYRTKKRPPKSQPELWGSLLGSTVQHRTPAHYIDSVHPKAGSRSSRPYNRAQGSGDMVKLEGGCLTS